MAAVAAVQALLPVGTGVGTVPAAARRQPAHRMALTRAGGMLPPLEADALQPGGAIAGAAGGHQNGVSAPGTAAVPAESSPTQSDALIAGAVVAMACMLLGVIVAGCTRLPRHKLEASTRTDSDSGTGSGVLPAAAC